MNARPKLWTGVRSRIPDPPKRTSSSNDVAARLAEAVSGGQLSAATHRGRHSRSIAGPPFGPRLATVAVLEAEKRRRAVQ